MKLSIIFVAAILGGCAATGAARIGGPGLSSASSESAKQEPRPKLLGEPGEKSAHFYARVLARVCAGNEDEDLVDEVEDDLADCKGPRLDCERAACASIAPALKDRCESLTLARQTALEQLRAELDVVVARNRH